jgi:hypothetical protein
MKGRVVKENDTLNIPVIGHIKIGEKTLSKNKKEIPRSLDYFRATGDYSNLFHNVYGEKPTSIKIAFISDNEIDSCYERYEIWKGQRKYGFGDGQKFRMYSEKLQGFVDVEPEPGKIDDFFKYFEDKTESRWFRVLTLRFLIPDIKGILGVWEFTTRAEKSTINNVVSVFDTVKNFGGTVKRTLFDLSVKMVTSKTYGNNSKYPVVTLIANMTPENIQKLQHLKDGAPLFLTDETIDDF